MTTAEILEIKQLARQFSEAELRPHVEKWDHDAALDPQALAQLAELGFFGMLVPEAYGGMEFDVPTYVSVIEELAWGEPSVALTVATNSFVADLLLQNGTDAMKQEWLAPIAGGEAIACVAHAEEGAGTDDAALETRAKRDGDGWVLNGEKHWVTNGRMAGLALVIARTDDDKAAGFIVPTDAQGYQVGEREQTMGFRPVEIVTVKLENVRVGAESIIAHSSDRSADIGRLAIAAVSVGLAQSALDHAIGYADIREQFHTKLRDFEGIQFKLAEMATRVEAARALLQRAAAEPSARLSAMAKFFASEAAMWVTTNAVQVYGGYGYMRDYPVEKLMRDAKATEILEGTNEIQRVIIARELYR
jgi:alkylation response protein AidB-like acyl-CoA dehydrogenase